VRGTIVRVRVRCPAKVNLDLEVLGRREDGYHEVRTLLAAVGLWDEIEIEPAGGGTFDLVVVPEGSAPPGRGNLVVRAAEALAASTGVKAGAHIRLSKAIPVGGGLGGGSSDAAATLIGLCRLWGLPAGFAELGAIAASLGADVPFFLLGGAAWGVGRGAEVYPLPDLPRWWVVLVPGSEPIPTRDVYATLQTRQVDSFPLSEVYRWVVSGGELPLSACHNDLQPTVTRGWPDIARHLQRVALTQPLLTMLSGSGGTVFGLYTDANGARRAAEQLADMSPMPAPLLGRRESLLEPRIEEGS
jgi:4-diphosphocytidyl-2-C-methyl-D-erythritol kinase